MVTTEGFAVVDGPPQHMLERALLVRDQDLRVVEFTVEFDHVNHSQITIPTTVRLLGHDLRYVQDTRWILGGNIRPDHKRDDEEFLATTLRWLQGKHAMPYYGAHYDSRSRKGVFALSDQIFIPELISPGG